ncbi:MAG: cobalamin biosynthesis protein [Clostridiaceae bacterium]|nr:cobalamin biosynthesis protein [Clostridiaceae bacterium]
MKVLMIACSRRAYDLMQCLKKQWTEQEKDLETVCLVRSRAMPELSSKESLCECVKRWIYKVDALVFFCAVGIAVRSVAPYLVHKSVDPAVVVIDETGRFCVSLLSGHAGGANALAKKLAGWIGAVPVITTATDREGKFSVDDFARENDLEVSSWELAKRISAAVLEGEQILFSSELPFEGELPGDLILEEQGDVGRNAQQKRCISQNDKVPGILVSPYRKSLRGEVLQLIPHSFILGIGCRRGVSKEQIAAAAAQLLQEENILPEAVWAVASISLKKNEPGILAFCEEKGLPFLTYSADELKQQRGDFSESAFVERTTGVSCVCERSAVAAQGQLFCRKKIYDGVTLALARRKGRLLF